VGTNLPIGKLKTTPDDFVVQELIGNPPVAVPFSDKTIIQGWNGRSAVTVFEMSKRDWETQTAVREVARQFGVTDGDISQHGIKDKRACTTSRIGVQGEFRPNFSHQDINLVQLYGQNARLRTGGNWGNRFNILVRSSATALDLAPAQAFPNLYGEQRTGKKGTEQVGRLLLEGKYQQAIELLHYSSKKMLFRAQKLAGGTLEGALFHPTFYKCFSYEIQKWRSYLWNELLAEKVDELGEDRLSLTFPMWDTSDRVYEMYQHLYDPSYLDPEVMRMIGNTERASIVRPVNLQAKREELGWRFTFDLPAGSFATVFLARLFDLKYGYDDAAEPQLTAEELERERDEFLDSLIKRLSHRL
jgi:tRNA(Glu) U13 pseudouridine synthase TruD